MKLKTIYSNSKSYFGKEENPLAHKLLMTILLVSSLITLVITGLQIQSEYTEDIRLLDQQMNQIEKSQRISLASSMWFLETRQFKNIIAGIINLKM